MKQYEFRWENLQTLASKENVDKWLDDPLYRRLLVLGYFLYGPIRCLVTAVPTLIVFFTSLTLLSHSNSLFSSAGTGQLPPGSLTVDVVIPAGYQAPEIWMFWLIFGAALFVVLFEQRYKEIFETHRPLSIVTIHIVYRILAGALRAYAAVRSDFEVDTEKLTQFRDELLYNYPAPEVMVFHYVQSHRA